MLIVVWRPDVYEKIFPARFPNSTAHAPDTLLGMNVNISNGVLKFSQPSLIRKGLEILKLENFFPVWKPLTPLEQLHTASEEDDRQFLKLNLKYRSYKGMLDCLRCGLGLI